MKTIKITLKNGLEIKRHFWNEMDYKIDNENGIVQLNKDMHKLLLDKRLWGKFGFKKLGGSTLGSITGTNPFGSKFKESCRIMWLDMPMFDDKYVVAGQVLEPKIIKALEDKLETKIATFPAAENNYDYFFEFNNVGGLPDGKDLLNEKIYEIKTTGKKNFDKWEKTGVPLYYQEQAQLYTYLWSVKHAVKDMQDPEIVACFLEPDDYAKINDVNIEGRILKRYKVKYVKQEIADKLKDAIDFRKQITSTGSSIKFDLTNKDDTELLSWLVLKNEEELKQWLKARNLI